LAKSRRIFIGIPVLEENCPKFFSWARNLVHESSLQNWKIRWSKPENYHITVCFLGDSDQHPIDQIIDTFSKETFSAFWIQIQQLGFFVNGRNSSVIGPESIHRRSKRFSKKFNHPLST